MDDAPIEVTHRVVVEAGVPVRVISFRGTYGSGSLGNGDAHRMRAAVETLVEAEPGPEVAVLDGTELGYEWGDMIDQVALPLGGLAWVWAVSERCAGGLSSYFNAEAGLTPREWLFEPLAAAVAEVVRRRQAGRFVLHGSKGGVARECVWMERGYREIEHGMDGGTIESLWVAQRRVERLERGLTGEVRWHVMWPFPDAAGGQSEACRLGGRVVAEQGRIRTLDFNPVQTRRPLNPEWLEAACSLPELRELDLSHTSVTDEDVASVFELLPGLTRLELNGSRVSDKSLVRLSEGAGPALRRVALFDCQVSMQALRALKAARPGLSLSHRGMFKRE